MVVTTHSIVDSWVLPSACKVIPQNMLLLMIYILIRFIHVRAPHNGKAFGHVLLQCLMDWNLDSKLFPLTHDNCFGNDKMIDYIL